MNGNKVKILEERKKGGGIKEYGIEEYKKVKNLEKREIDLVLKIGGINIEYKKKMGKEIKVEEMKEGYDEVLIEMGMKGVKEIGIEGEEEKKVMDEVD